MKGVGWGGREGHRASPGEGLRDPLWPAAVGKKQTREYMSAHTGQPHSRGLRHLGGCI